MILTPVTVKFNPHTDVHVPFDGDEPDDTGFNFSAEETMEAVVVGGVLVIVTDEGLKMSIADKPSLKAYILKYLKSYCHG